MAGMGLQLIIGKRGVKMGKGLTVFSSCEVTLQRDKFSPLGDVDAMVHVVIVHVAVGAVPCSPDAAGDGCSIKANGVRKGLKRGVDFFTWVQSYEQVITASGPFHVTGQRWRVMRLPFTRSRPLGHQGGVLVPWP